jgi:hypothetical protein
LAVLKYPITPQQGGFSTNPIGITMQIITPGATASIRLSVHRFVRHFTGPVLAFFSRSAA